MTEQSYGRLVSKILEDAKLQSRSIVEEAKSSAEKQLEQNRKAAEERGQKSCREIRRSTEAEVENIIHRESVDAIVKTRWTLLSEKRKIIDDVFRRSEEKLRSFTKENSYIDLLVRLIEEASIAAGGGKLKIILNKEDSQKKLPINDISKRVSAKLDVETSLEVSKKNNDALGGAIIQSSDERTKIDNTLEAVLERTRKKLEPTLTTILFSEKT